MKINPTDQCLSLILRALEVGVLPEVTSDAATRAIELITITLKDLLKRHQQPSIDFLTKCIKNALRIESEICLVLKMPPTTVDSSFYDVFITNGETQMDWLLASGRDNAD